MIKLISCCGIDCSACEARIATINNNNELRKKTAQKWKSIYKIPELPADAINCTGCREDGAKIGHCEKCEIKNCVISKGFQTCAECNMLETCDTVGKILNYKPQALENLKSLN